MNSSISAILIALLTAVMVPTLLKLARYIKTHDAYLEVGIKRLNLMDDNLCYFELSIQNETKKDLLLKDLCLLDKDDKSIASLKSEPFLKKGDVNDKIIKNEDGTYSLISVSNSSLTALYSFSIDDPVSPFYVSFLNDEGKRFYGKMDENVYRKGYIHFSSKKN